MNKDLTVGKPESVLFHFCLPLFGSVIFQQLYNIADSLVAGKFLGEEALAAVGNSYELTLIFIAIGYGCNIGCSVIASQLFGARNYRDLRTSITTTFISTALLTAVVMAVGLILCNSMLTWINTPENIFTDSALYLRIYIFSLPFNFFYNIATGVFSALGDSKTPFVFLAVSSLANIGMDILFVASFGMGIAGVGWATFICQGVACVLAVAFLFRRLTDLPAGDEPAPVFSGALLKRITAVAVPGILQQSLISVGNIILQGTINQYGSSVIAGYSAAIKLNNMLINALMAFCNGVSNYSGQNLGAGKLERIPQGFKAGVKLAWCLCIPVALLFFFGGRLILQLFLNDPAGEAMRSGMMFLRITSPFYIVVAVKLTADGVLRGTGMMKQFMLSTFSDLILRVSLALIFSSFVGWVGIWVAWPFGWTCGTVVAVLCYRNGDWKSVKKAPFA